MKPYHTALALALAVAACSPPAQQQAASSPQPEAPAAPPAPTPEPPPAGGEQGGTDDWRKVATADDADRLSRLDQAWRLGRAEAEDRGFGADLAAAGAVLKPDAALPGRPMPAPGAYRCRTYKLGSQSEGGLGFVAYPFFPCRVDLTPGGDLILEKTGGSQRARGLIYPDNEARTVFVGAQALGTEKGFPDYGSDALRNQLGVVERIGDRRWRLVVPWPAVESKLAVTDISP